MGKRDDVRNTHFHSLRRDFPLSSIDAELGPFPFPKLTGAYKYKGGKSQGALSDDATLIAIYRTQQFANRSRFRDGCVVCCHRRGQRTPKVSRWIAFVASGGDGISEY